MRAIRGRWAIGILIVFGIVGVSFWLSGGKGGHPLPSEQAVAAGGETIQNPFPRRVQLSDDYFSGGNGWLNVSGPIELRDLRGKIVVLDFWTYCCINCMHVLPDLKYLEHKYPRDLVVIGVHSAKFDNEKDSENIRRAILRYDIEHPVVNDSQMTIWRQSGVNAWPTIALIDPEGKYIGALSGEGHRARLDELIGKLVAYHKATKTLDESPLKLGLERKKLAASPLKFPGKLVADEQSGRLFISDSNHNRIVIATLAGKLIDVAGSGAPGAKNGSFATATFNHPQGVAVSGTNLFVADTENHLIRVLDLEHKTVSTLAGTGLQDHRRSAGGALRETPLNSPWDVVVVNRTLYVAMAGAQQIWSHVLGSEVIQPWAGTGREDVLNGPRDEAAFGQPSGLATDGNLLFVADSEGSAIRKVALSGTGAVSTLAGTSDLDGGRSLFEFGDANGRGAIARFQHPLGVACSDGRVYVADTYNHKIKVIDVSTGEALSWLGSGKRGDGVDPPEFSEPGGLSVANGALYIADTNNHVIKLAELKTKQVRTLTIEGLTPPKIASKTEATGDDDEAASAAAAAVESQHVTPGDALRIEISFKLPEGFKLNKAAPASCRLRVHGPQNLVAAAEIKKSHRAAVEGERLVVSIPLAAKMGTATFDASLSYTYCRDGVGGLCKLGMARWTVPIELSEGAKQSAIRLVADAARK
jgi:thiol-disulfide isomerase/thioredoxin